MSVLWLNYINKNKFNRMKTTMEKRHDTNDVVDKRKWVDNLSTYSLTEVEESLLRRGLNFTTVPRRVPLLDIASVVESVADWMRMKQVNLEALYAAY